MKIAFIHDWLVQYAGAERVLEQMLSCFPEGDLYSIIDFREQNEPFLKGKKVNTSFLQKWPFMKKHYRKFIGLMPLAAESLDLSGYEIIISSSHAVAKGVLSGPDQLHLCMNYSPMRYAWDLQSQYLSEVNLHKGIKGFFAKALLHYLRIWDLRTINGVDDFIAISKFISRRILKIYGRSSEVIYPPVDVDRFEFQDEKEDFYLTASRMVPYKKISLIVEAFNNMPDKKLVLIGDGPEMKKIKKMAGENINVLGYKPFDTLRSYLQRARAFIFAAEEDFGIAPIEAQSCGTPVIAYGKGGALETINGLDSEKPTGIFFEEQTVENLINAVEKFEVNRIEIKHQDCRQNALRFGKTRFDNEFKEFVLRKWSQFNSPNKSYWSNEPQEIQMG